MSNPAMPGMVKIGRSFSVSGRAAQLSNLTAVPLPFAIEFEETCDDEAQVEAIAHRILSACRVNPLREFFRATVQEAICSIRSAALMSAWNKASSEARQEFLERIETPVFDRSTA